MKVLVLDDHSIILTGIVIRLKEKYSDCEVDGFHTGKDVLVSVKNKDYDLIILDVNVPGTDINNLVSSILVYKSNSKILIFSAHPENIFAKKFLKLGAKGYLCKDADKDRFYTAIDTILKGKTYLSQELIEELANESFSKVSVKNPFDLLSERELAVCNHLVSGMNTNEISILMNLKPTTVSTYKTRIFEKLNVKNVIELIKVAEVWANNIN